MTSVLTRRGLVAAAPAAVVAATLPALAAGAHPDAELLALREPYERTMADIDAAGPAHTRAEEALIAARKAQPDIDQAALAEATGFAQADRIWTSVVDANGAVIARIIETPARTLEGLVFKASICDRECFNLDLAEAIVADLVAMGGLHA